MNKGLIIALMVCIPSVFAKNEYNEYNVNNLLAGSLLSIEIPHQKIDEENCFFYGKILMPVITNNPTVTFFNKNRLINLSCSKTIDNKYNIPKILGESEFYYSLGFSSEFNLNKTNNDESSTILTFTSWSDKIMLPNLEKESSIVKFKVNNNFSKINNIIEYKNSIVFNLNESFPYILFFETMDNKSNKIILDVIYKTNKQIIVQKSPFDNYFIKHSDNNGLDENKITTVILEK